VSAKLRGMVSPRYFQADQGILYMTGKAKGTIYALVCVALWGLIPVVAKLGQSSLDNHQFLFWSSLVSFLVLTSNAAISGKLREIKTYSLKDWFFISFLGLLGTYLYYLFLYLGYAQAKGLEVLVIQYTWPIIIVVLSYFILKEKIDYRKITALFLGFLGVVTVLTKGEFDQINVSNPSVIALVGTGAICFALFSVLSKSVLAKNVKKSTVVIVSLYFLTALIASFISMLYFSVFSTPTASEITPILINGILVNGYSYIFWVKALQATEASYLAPFTFIAPILSAVYLIMIFNEPVVIAYGLGLTLIVIGGLINSIRDKKLDTSA